MLREDRANDKRLVGYYVRRESRRESRGTDPLPTGEDSRLHGPGGFVELPQLPLTQSGKIDRRATRSRRDAS